jgi:Conjugative transposon protein TcpC
VEGKIQEVNMKKPKLSKPKLVTLKTHNWRKILKISLWTLVIFWTLGSLRGFTLAAKVNSLPNQQQVETKVEKENFAVSVGAQKFAENFLREYFTWNKDNYQERVDRLKPYLRKGIDEQAGLKFDSLTGNSSPEKTELWQVSESGDKTSEITFRVTHTIKTMAETQDEQGNITQTEQATGPFEKWIEVSVITDGTTFLINGIPTFTSKPPEANISPLQSETEHASVVTSEVKKEITEFLNTFYKQYSTGTIEELEYLTTDKTVRPLDGTIVFNQIEDLLILEKKENGYLIKTKAIFTENQSKAQLIQNHSMIVSKAEDDRWQIIKFN